MSQEEGTDAANQAEQSDTHKPRLKWTIMIYLAGDNNLSANSLSVLQQLEAAFIPFKGDVRVLACFDANTPRPRAARYLEIKHGRFHDPEPRLNWGLHNDLVVSETLREELGVEIVETPSFCDAPTTPYPTPVSDVKEGLSRFLRFALKNHPAERYMLILYGHGSVVAGNTFLADNNPPSFLRLRDFAEVLKKHFDVRDDTEQHGDWYEAHTDGEPPSQNKPPYKRKPALDILACDNCIMNGIEMAYEVKGQVKYVLGSQGLALAVGWPFRKIINVVVRHRYDRTKHIAERLLRVCARNLMDFMLMDRSSEQSLCDLTTLHHRPNLVEAVRGLSKAMQKGLKVKDATDTLAEHQYIEIGEVLYPPVRDAIRQARLEAQSYWGERFVDLYDFCALLLERCNDHLYQFYGLGVEFERLKYTTHGEKEFNLSDLRKVLGKACVVRKFREIARWCRAVLREIKTKRFVLKSYYIGPALQYSNGVSIYFPWTLPERPVIFEPVDTAGNCAPAGSYGISWAGLSKLKDIPQNYAVKTAFEEYQTYEFAKECGGDWADFLVRFFKATLRDVRRFDFRYVKPKKVQGQRNDADFFFFVPQPRAEDLVIPPERVDLQKTDSDTGDDEDCTCPEIKNYPRRFYISPADCKRVCPLPHVVRERDSVRRAEGIAGLVAEDGVAQNGEKPCASYLGWNIRGLVAEVIQLKDGNEGTPDTPDFDEARAMEAEEPDSDEPDCDELDFDEDDSDETELDESDDDEPEE